MHRVKGYRVPNEGVSGLEGVSGNCGIIMRGDVHMMQRSIIRVQWRIICIVLSWQVPKNCESGVTVIVRDVYHLTMPRSRITLVIHDLWCCMVPEGWTMQRNVHLSCNILIILCSVSGRYTMHVICVTTSPSFVAACLTYCDRSSQKRCNHREKWLQHPHPYHKWAFF